MKTVVIGQNIPPFVRPKGAVYDEEPSLKSSTVLSNKDELPSFVAPDAPSSVQWILRQFPSKCVPYLNEVEGKGLYVRNMDIKTLSKVHAAQDNKSLSSLLDALQDLIKFPIRDLTVPDFYSFLYWLRLTSYPKSPKTVQWTSQYGDKITTTVNLSHFEVTELNMTRQEYREWNAKGIAFPTMRDMESIKLDEESNDESEKWLKQYAQYIYVETESKDSDEYTAMKRQKLEKLGVDVLSLVKDFAEQMEHGVIEQITVTNDKFNLDEAIQYVESEIKFNSQMVEASLTSSGEPASPDFFNRLTNLAAYIDNRIIQLKEMKTAKEENKRYEPEKEVISVSASDPYFLFP
jgi:hypothetical protein